MIEDGTISSDDYTGPVWVENTSMGTGGEGFFREVHEYLDACACDDREPDHRIFTTINQTPPCPDMDRCVRDWLSDGEAVREDAYDCIKAGRIEALQAYMTEWFATCGVVSWIATRTRVVLSEKHLAEFAAMKAE